MLLSVGHAAHAHPTPYKGAKVLMFNQYESYQEYWLAYSPYENFSIAERFQYYKTEKATDHRPQVNYRLLRANEMGSQANVYLMAGPGFSGREKDSPAYFWHSTLAADWESRRYYTSVELGLSRGQIQEHMMQYRVGFAPYLGEYETLNTWFILEARYMTMIQSIPQQWELTPFLRFYYQNVLWEVGANQRGTFRFNFMLHL